MYRSFVVFGLYLSFAIAVGAACGPAPLETPSDDDDDSAPRGGSNGSGGSSSGGTGNVATGGTGNFGTTGGTGPATGGTGNVGTGGTVSSGGMAGRASGGASAMAGRAAGGSAGTPPATGGTVGTTGGTTGTTGGTGGTVGAAGTGTSGSAGTGSGTVSCDPMFSVGNGGFVRAPMAGGACWHGYAFAGGDSGSTVMPTDFKSCMSPCSLTAMGEVGPATTANDFVGSVYLGFSVGEPAGGGTKATVTPTGTSIVVTATAPTGARVQLQGPGGDKDATKRWCATLTSGVAITYDTFNTACWDNSGAKYTKGPIEAVQIVVPGGETAASFTIAITSIKEM